MLRLPAVRNLKRLNIGLQYAICPELSESETQQVLIRMRTPFYRFRFDFDVGMLVKSPCKECLKRWHEFPACMEECEVLNKIQQILAEVRSCSKG
jgi:hypothetical protein